MSDTSENDTEQEAEIIAVPHWGEIVDSPSKSNSSDSNEGFDLTEDIKKAMDLQLPDFSEHSEESRASTSEDSRTASESSETPEDIEAGPSSKPDFPEITEDVKDLISGDNETIQDPQQQEVSEEVKAEDESKLSDVLENLEELSDPITEDIKMAMDPNYLAEFEDEDCYMPIDNITLPPMDPLMIYAIQLHKWMRAMTDTINVVELAMGSNLIPSLDQVQPIPEMPDIHLRHKQNMLNFIPSKNPEESEEHEDLDVPELSRPIVENILKKCIATMFAHIGYETTHQSVLDVLVDVLNHFFIKVCNRFVDAMREEETLNTGGFPHVLERTFVELGIGSTKDLNDYYQCRVLKYINVLRERCIQLEKYYTSLTGLKSQIGNSATKEIDLVFNVKPEDEGLETDMKMDVDNQSEIFSAGFQLLDSLEASTR